MIVLNLSIFRKKVYIISKIKFKYALYFDEFIYYFKRPISKEEIKRLRSAIPKDNGFINTNSFIKLIKKEYKDKIKNLSDYNEEILRLKDEVNTSSGFEKAFNTGVIFFSGFLISKSTDALKSLTNLNGNLNYFISIIIAAMVFLGAVYYLFTVKFNEYFYLLCLNVLEQMKDKLQD